MEWKKIPTCARAGRAGRAVFITYGLYISVLLISPYKDDSVTCAVRYTVSIKSTTQSKKVWLRKLEMRYRPYYSTEGGKLLDHLSLYGSREKSIGKIHLFCDHIFDWLVQRQSVSVQLIKVQFVQKNLFQLHLQVGDLELFTVLRVPRVIRTTGSAELGMELIRNSSNLGIYMGSWELGVGSWELGLEL